MGNYVYIVTGSYGEYDDYNEWTVKAFYKKSDAEDYCDEINKEIKEHIKKYKNIINIKLECDSEESDRIDCIGSIMADTIKYNYEEIQIY